MKLLTVLFLALSLAPAQDNKHWGPLVLNAIQGLVEWQPRAKGFEYESETEEKKLALDGSLKEQNKSKYASKEMEGRRPGRPGSDLHQASILT